MSEGREITRAGAFGLSLLADPLNVEILDALKDGHLPLPDLRRAVGAPPQTTLRNRLRVLAEAGAVDRHQEDGFPGHVSYELTQSGRALAGTARILAAWLTAAPESPLKIGSPAARSAVKALVGGWSTNVLRALAAKPLSLTELDRVITGINYPALERRLDAMRLTGQVVAVQANGSRPYSVTRWLREGVAPLVAAVGWERRAILGTPALNRLDVEALFLLAIPMLRLSGAPDGACRLEVQLAGKKSSEAAGVVITIKGGRATSCRASLQGQAPNWTSGTTAAWLSALGGHDQTGIAMGGDPRLSEALISGFQEMLTSARGGDTLGRAADSPADQREAGIQPERVSARI
jgi:DNA-binding HxlR family transcriptional regulator